MGLLDVVLVGVRYAVYIFVPWVLGLLFYRVSLHPLSKYPGPVLGKLTYAYRGFYAIKKKPHINAYRDSQKYGSVYREAPNRLVFSSLKAIEDIYYNPRVTKGRAYRHARWIDERNLFDTPDKNEHRRKRKVFGQVVSERWLRKFHPTMSAQINVFLRQLLDSSQKGEVVDMTLACKRLAIDVVGYLAFGNKLNTQTEATNRFIPEAMGNAIYMTNVYYTWPTLRVMVPVLRWLAKEQAGTFQAAVRKMILARIAEPKDAKADFYSQARGEFQLAEDNIEDSEFWSEALFFVSAGGTTVSSALCGIFFNLTRNPDVYARLANEIRTTFSSGLDINNGPKLAGCKYLRAVTDESLRLSPPSLSPLWREAEPSSTEPFVVDGHVIPRGTEVSVHPYSILHNANYFPEPFAFRPERWLGPEDGGAPHSPEAEAEAEAARATMRRAQVTFGMGDRSCVGKAMAYMETYLTIARTLWYFDFEIPSGEAGKLGAGREGSKDPWATPDQYQLRDILVADHDGPNLVFVPRGDYWRELEVEEEQEG